MNIAVLFLGEVQAAIGKQFFTLSVGRWFPTACNVTGSGSGVELSSHDRRIITISVDVIPWTGIENRPGPCGFAFPQMDVNKCTSDQAVQKRVLQVFGSLPIEAL
jgi:hypothetical protein